MTQCTVAVLGTSHDDSLSIERFEYKQGIDHERAQAAIQSRSGGPLTAGTTDPYHDDSGLSINTL